jgi:hypothetical protein
MEGQPLRDRNGNPRTEYFFAIAVSKEDPGLQDLLDAYNEAAVQGFPKLFPNKKDCINEDFSWKYIDGDSDKINKYSGKKPCELPGFAGHMVFKFKSGFAPDVYYKGGEIALKDPEEIKRGYYVRVFGSVTANNLKTNPGVYANPVAVEFVGIGDEIKSEGNRGRTFGDTPAFMPKDMRPIPKATNAFEE